MNDIRSTHVILAVTLFALFSYAMVHFGSQAQLNNGNPELKTDSGSVPLNIVVPGQDSVNVEMGRHRIAANTKPGSRAFLNGEEVTVYPNGAFAGLVEVPPGYSTSEIRVHLPDGDTIRKEKHFFRSDPIETLPESPLAISERMMKPDQPVVLNNEDHLEVRFKGSPGAQAYFSIEGIVEQKPMRELPRRQTGGIEGVYTGSYEVLESDEIHNVPVIFLLKNGNETVTAQSGTHVSMTPSEFPKTAKIIGRRTTLNFEPEADRLGGSPLGYLEEGIHVDVTGHTGRFHRVRLSGQTEAYLPRFFAEILPEHIPPPLSATGTVSVIPEKDHDKIMISFSQRLPYTSVMKTNPNAIEVDIYGAGGSIKTGAGAGAGAEPGTSAGASAGAGASVETGAGTESGTGIRSPIPVPEESGLDRIEWQEIGEGHRRLVIIPGHDLHWGYQTGYGAGNSLEIKVRRPPELQMDSSGEPSLKGITIAVDAGHGGGNTGGLGSAGSYEKDLVLDIAKRVRLQLEAMGAQVFMTREDDIDLSMEERTRMIIATNAHALVSIHANSIGYATDPLAIQGTSTYYRHAGFRPLARIMHRHMLELPLNDFGLFGDFNFTLNRLTEMPNVLVETAFVSHPEDEMKLLDPAFRDEIAGKIAAALHEFFERYGVSSGTVGNTG